MSGYFNLDVKGGSLKNLKLIAAIVSADVEKDVLGRVLCQPEASWLGNVDLEVVGGEPETMLRELLPNRRRHAACIQASG